MRTLPRNSEGDYWPRVSASISGILTQEGTLHGIDSKSGSHNIQINPYLLAQNEKTLFSLDPANPFFSSRKLEGTAGGEAKVVIKDSIVVDGTINPDFSDIESDQPQFTVNQRYPVFFPELRPFFLENANYFSTPIPKHRSSGIWCKGDGQVWAIECGILDDRRSRTRTGIR